MDKLQEEKIKQFLNDRVMADAVYQILLNSFLKDEKQDVYLLAASRLSINYLKQAWKELQNYKDKKEEVSGINYNVGL